MTKRTRKHPKVEPMRVSGTANFIERTYRESGAHQWVRETTVNALEAGAEHIELGIEWQGVESKAVYRRTIIDDGRGMSGDELRSFFNTFGGGGKPIGGAHENFGVGSKTSLLPWNREGLVVVSRVDGQDSMIWVLYDPDTGDYGLRVFEAQDPTTGAVTLETVVEPFEDEDYGCDWSKVLPAWVGDHGTAIVLLGNDRSQDTVLGDPSRSAEQDIKGVSSYLNRRMWELPAGTTLRVDELRGRDKSGWPRNEAEAHGPPSTPDRRTNTRKIEGARHFIEYPARTFTKGRLGQKGKVTLPDGTVVEWFLWDGERPQVHSYAAKGGYIATLYKDELYDVTSHLATYRTFGICERAVRDKLWLVIHPRKWDETSGLGVYPRTDRNALLMRGGPDAGGPLPVAEWAAEFADQLPDPILAAIRASRGKKDGTIRDAAWRDRLSDRFGSRWKILRRKRKRGGTSTVTPTHPGTEPPKPAKPRPKPTRPSPTGTKGGSGGLPALGDRPGSDPAAETRVAGGLPDYRPVHDGDIDPGYLAAWQSHDPDHPCGVVLLNVDHPVLVQQIEYWQAQFATHHAETVAEEVIAVYGEVAVAKIAHSEHLRGMVTPDVLENELRSDGALTMALLGLVAEEKLIELRLRTKLGRRRAS
jgi:hypothetical protein